MRELSSVETGNFVKVGKLVSHGFLRERMLAIGLTKDAEVQVIQRGPSGDPTVYNIRGAMIALRRDEASLVYVY